MVVNWLICQINYFFLFIESGLLKSNYIGAKYMSSLLAIPVVNLQNISFGNESAGAVKFNDFLIFDPLINRSILILILNHFLPCFNKFFYFY